LITSNGSVNPLTVQASGGLSNLFAINTLGGVTVGTPGYSTGVAGANRIQITNATAPSGTPVTSGVLFVENGALKYKGSSGTVTTIANA
jgi:hypothetical protein